MIDLPAFSHQQDVQPPIAVADASAREVFQSHPQFGLRVSVMTVVVTRAREGQYLTCATLRHSKAGAEKLRQCSHLAQASELFSQHLLEHVLIKGEIGDQRLESLVFVFELPQACEFGDTHAGELFLPAVESLFGDACLAADFQDWCAGFGLSQSVDDLLIRGCSKSCGLAL